MNNLNWVDVTPENIESETLFCVKNTNSQGFKDKHAWFLKRFDEGLKIRILKEGDKMIGFIEFIPAEHAWRPVDANGYLFIHCMYVYSKKDRNQGLGGMLVDLCMKEAEASKRAGICTMASKGSWSADRRLFEKCGFTKTDQRGRFELLTKKIDPNLPDPQLLDWESRQSQYQGWHLLYADQCPWHEKSAKAIQKVGEEHGVQINIQKITSATEAKNGPSGFGVFSVLHNGVLLEDHYLSESRFKNILAKELSKEG